MLSFEIDLHGPDEEVGLYTATVLYDYVDTEEGGEVINLKVTVFEKDASQKKEHSTIAIKYRVSTREYEPLLGAETNELYASVILMLEETLKAHWGHEIKQF